MDRKWCALIPLFCLASASAPSPNLLSKPTETSVFRGKAGQHSFVLRLGKGPFRKERYKITSSKTPGGVSWPQIDGQFIMGIDGRLPLEEFYAFEVTVDSKRWPIPAKLYKDCCNPNIRYSKPPFVWTWLSTDGKHLTVKMRGSDGAGAYGVIWHLRRNGKHSREFWQRS